MHGQKAHVSDRSNNPISVDPCWQPRPSVSPQEPHFLPLSATEIQPAIVKCPKVSVHSRRIARRAHRRRMVALPLIICSTVQYLLVMGASVAITRASELRPNLPKSDVVLDLESTFAPPNTIAVLALTFSELHGPLLESPQATPQPTRSLVPGQLVEIVRSKPKNGQKFSDRARKIPAKCREVLRDARPDVTCSISSAPGGPQ